MNARHFLTLMDFSSAELASLIERAGVLKRGLGSGEAGPEPLRNRVVALIFELASTRTRLSFEAAVTHFGGNALFLAPGDSQMQRGEPVEDTARVTSSMVDAIVIRTTSHARLERFAEYSAVPVINALSDRHHPCQLLADVQTYVEARGPIRGIRAAWIGDGNNVCQSWMEAAVRFDFELVVAVPEGFEPDARILERCGSHVRQVRDPAEATRGAHVVVTDTWASMGQEEEKEKRMKAFAGFCVDPALMRHARSDSVFMHCLPAYRGMEVAAEVIDGPQSVVWDQAENRLHAQKALLENLLAPGARGADRAAPS